MEILALSGSIRSGSYNTALLNAVRDVAPRHVNVTLFESIYELPVFNPDIEDDNSPRMVNTLTSRIRESDGLIISTPEYAHGLSGVLKNMLDWLVASDALILKPVVVTSVSTSSLGGVRSLCSLVQVLTAMNANVVVEGSLCVPYAKKKFDADLKLTDQITLKAIAVSLLAVERAIDQGV